MTIRRVKPQSWGVGEKYTSAQCNGLDANTAAALDKRAGQTDLLASVVTCAGAGRIVPTVLTAVDANTTFEVGGANSFIRVTTLTTQRIFTLSNTNAIMGDQITVFVENTVAASVLIKDASGNAIFELGTNADGEWASFVWLAGWKLFQHSHGARLRAQTFLQNGGGVVPRGVSQMIVGGYGGGGGGGCGGSGENGRKGWAIPGGGGGGGSNYCVAIVPVIPGTTFSVFVGDAGKGAAEIFYDGSDGGDAMVETNAGALVTFGGAQGGASSVFTVDKGALLPYGGAPVRGAPPFRSASQERAIYVSDLQAFLRTRIYSLVPGQGGFGSSATMNTEWLGWGASNAIRGPYSLGGSPGDSGALGDNSGGGGGGGGGGGPYSSAAGGEGRAPAGGRGGDGGPSDGRDGSKGDSAPANSGAGGGGGGAAGTGAITSGNGGAGGDGGSGMITIAWVQ